MLKEDDSVKTLEQMIAELEGVGGSNTATAALERLAEIDEVNETPVDPENSPEFQALLARAVAARDKYLEAKEDQDAALLELLQYMRKHGIEKTEYNGRIISAAPEYEVEYDPALAEALKGVLSEKQWNQCFRVDPPRPLKTGLNKFLKMNSAVSDIIRAHQIMKQVPPKPSCIRIDKPKRESA